MDEGELTIAIAFIVVVVAVLAVTDRGRAFLAQEFGMSSLYRTRRCPRCGQKVTVGELDCPHCEFDFRTIGSQSDT